MIKKTIPGKKDSLRQVHYVLSTHWDREWYQTFQDYRRRLVKLLDRVLDDIEAGKLRGPFTLDGQAILIEDYLEIRPERRQKMEESIQAGQLIVGPWYVLPDEWLVSGESIIRNLELGRRIARQWGGTPSNAGFLCDLFGHISQMPQLMRGFGITGGLVWRGLEPRSSAHVLWRGADGTELPCYRFGRSGYCDYTVDVRHSTEPNYVFAATEAVSDLRTFLKKEADRTAIPPVLLFDGADHLEYDADHYRVLFEQAPDKEFPYQVTHSTLDAYLTEMLKHRREIKDVVEGELREAAILPSRQDQQWLIPGVLSSRVWIKQANAECQSLLCQWAEPFACMAQAFLGIDYPHGYLDSAWKWLLMNHPHDSICGCSIDEVHEDMKYRFAQCRQIAQGQVQESLRFMAMAVEGEVGEKELRVLVANPLTREMDEPVELTLHFPAEWGCYNEFFGFEPKPSFRIWTAEGKEIPYQLLRQALDQAKTRVHGLKFPASYKTNDVTVCLSLKLPALGYTTLLVREGERSPQTGAIVSQMLPTRHRQTPGLATSERSMENEFLAVVIETNGTLTLTDKRTGEIYQRLLFLEDCADIGDGWFHGEAVNDQRFVSTGARADIALVHDGAALCRFRIRFSFSVPLDYEFGKRIRSESFVPLQVDSEITLRAGCDRLEVTMSVDNAARDHRLRVLFPSGVRTDSYFSDSAFDVVERHIALPKDNNLKRELVVETMPQQSWTALAKGKRGLAIVSTGLMEASVRDLPERPLALTLFRATRRTVFTDGQPLGQLQGRMKFDFWIVPLPKGIARRTLFDCGAQIAAGLRCVQLRAFDFLLGRPAGRLPATASFLDVEGDGVVTSVRQVEGQLQVRLFNPEMSRENVSLSFAGWPKGTRSPQGLVPVDLDHVENEKAIQGRSKMTVVLDPKKIVTLQGISSSA